MKSAFYIALVFSFILLSGCKPNREEGKEGRTDSQSSQPQHFKKTSGEPENFNRDIHVIRTLWVELGKLDGTSAGQDDRKILLIQALEERVSVVDSSTKDLDKKDQELLRQIRIYLNENAVSTSGSEGSGDLKTTTSP